MLRPFLPAAVIVVVMLFASSCRRGERFDYDDVESADTLTHHAEYLTIADYGNGTVAVDIADPWHEDAFLGRYALVHCDSVVPDDLPDNVRVIRVPVGRMAVNSAVHTSGLEELGALSSIVAVADGSFFTKNDTISGLIADGRITDIGPAAAPSPERLAASGAEVLLRSPMQGITAPPLPSSIVPVELADYLEKSPIARAEWLLLLGELSGKRDLAREIFTGVIDRYSDLTFKAAGAQSDRPKVLTETEQSGVWYVPAGNSYMARMLVDAGADYPWSDTDGTGSLALSLEKVADTAIDADIWLVRDFGHTPDAASLRALNPRYAAFKALLIGNVYGCDTSVKPLFNDIAFHPEKVLADYVAIFHPELMPDYQLKYFTKSK